MKKAFTLIELLIVIAIIGILAGIVVVSLTGALKKGKDSRIQADLRQVTQIAGMIMSDKGSYDELCSGGKLNTTSGDYKNQLTTVQNDIQAQQGGTTVDLSCYASGNDYCVSARLVSTTNYFCIDSAGNATTTASNNCTSANLKCTP